MTLSLNTQGLIEVLYSNRKDRNIPTTDVEVVRNSPTDVITPRDVPFQRRMPKNFILSTLIHLGMILLLVCSAFAADTSTKNLPNTKRDHNISAARFGFVRRYIKVESFHSSSRSGSRSRSNKYNRAIRGYKNQNAQDSKNDFHRHPVSEKKERSNFSLTALYDENVLPRHRNLISSPTYGNAFTDGTNKEFTCSDGQPLINLSGRKSDAIDQLTGKCGDGKSKDPIGGTGGDPVTATDCPTGYTGGTVKYLSATTNTGFVDEITLMCGTTAGSAIGNDFGGMLSTFACPLGTKIIGIGANVGQYNSKNVLRNLYIICSSWNTMMADKNQLQTAVNLWISNKTSASTTYGHIRYWDTSRVTDMSNLFQSKPSFNEDLSLWDVSNVTSMVSMFDVASSFKGDISSWIVSNVKDMASMFNGASDFNQNISRWNVSMVTKMSQMFSGASSFNGDLSRWDVSNVTTMSNMFYIAAPFNGNISTWKVVKVKDMGAMFQGVSPFNGDVSRWDVSNVTNMANMFNQASSFNGDISAWNVAKVVNMNSMFSYATSFNADVSIWDVSKVLDMSNMFFQASKFNRGLCWNTNQAVTTNMFTNSGTSQNVSFSYKRLSFDIFTDNYPNETTWNFRTYSAGQLIKSGGPYGLQNYHYISDACVDPTQCYRLTMKDSRNNGMCCLQGNGSYTVTMDGLVVASGGTFASTEAKIIGSGCPPTQTISPSMRSSRKPSNNPSMKPSKAQTAQPILKGLTNHPTTRKPTMPTKLPTMSPSTKLSLKPSNQPTSAVSFNRVIVRTEVNLSLQSVQSIMNNRTIASFEGVMNSWLDDLFAKEVPRLSNIYATVISQKLSTVSLVKIRNLRPLVIDAKDPSLYHGLKRVLTSPPLYALDMKITVQGIFPVFESFDYTYSNNTFRDQLINYCNQSSSSLTNALLNPTQNDNYVYFSNVTRIFTSSVAYTQSRRKNINVIVGVIGGLVVPVVIVTILCWIFLKQRSIKDCTKSCHLSIMTWPKQVCDVGLVGGMHTRKDKKNIYKGRRVVLDALVVNQFSPAQKVPIRYIEYVTDEWKNLLGSGGFGSVYKGVDKGINIEVAIKTLRSDRRHHKYQLEFEEEIKKIESLRHPNIVRILATCFESGFNCMVLEYAAGGSVQSILWLTSTRSLFSPASRLYVAQCLVAAVRHLHTHNILHRDIKPENTCMLYENWFENPHAILIDFGIAKSVSNQVNAGLTMTSNPGTKYFMAPEYIDKYHFDSKSDVFSIGVSLICMLTSDYSLVNNAVDCEHPDLIKEVDILGGVWPEDILTDFSKLISNCCCHKPDDRPSVQALFDGLIDLRERNGALERLPVNVSRRITAHSLTSTCTESVAVVDEPIGCVLCGCVTVRGILCMNNHLTCYQDTCLESWTRGCQGDDTIPCPGKCCSESFSIRDLFGKLNADVYGELVWAMNENRECKYFVTCLTRKIQTLQVQLRGNIVASRLVSVQVDCENIPQLSSSFQIEAVRSLKQLANKTEKEEQDLKHEREKLEQLLKAGFFGDTLDDTQHKLSMIMQKQKSAKMEQANNIQLPFNGQLQFPHLFVFIPASSSPRMMKSRFCVHKSYRMYFLCSHDYSIVPAAITLEQPKAWFHVIAPVLKWVVLVLRILVSVYDVSFPHLLDTINQTESFHVTSMDDILSHMEYLLQRSNKELERLQKDFDECEGHSNVMRFLRDFRMNIPQEAFGAVAVQVYKPTNLGWMDQMELADCGTEYAWVKKGKTQAWKRATNRSIKRNGTLNVIPVPVEIK